MAAPALNARLLARLPEPLRRLVPRAATREVEAADVQGLLLGATASCPNACYLLLQAQDAAGARAWLAELFPRDHPGAGGAARGGAANRLHPRGPGGARAARAPRHGFSAEFIAGMIGEHRSRFLGDEDDSHPQAWPWGGPGSPRSPVHLL